MTPAQVAALRGILRALEDLFLAIQHDEDLQTGYLEDAIDNLTDFLKDTP